MLLAQSVLKDDWIDNLAAEDAPPPGKMLAVPIKLLEDHDAATSMTLHLGSLLSIGEKPTLFFLFSPTAIESSHVRQ